MELGTTTTTSATTTTVRARRSATVQVRIELGPGWKTAEGVIWKDMAFLRKMIPLFVSP